VARELESRSSAFQQAERALMVLVIKGNR